MSEMKNRNASKVLIGAGLFDIVLGLLIILFGVHYLGIDPLVMRLVGGILIVTGIAVIVLGVYIKNRAKQSVTSTDRRSGGVVER